jgi:FMN reductase
VTDRAVSVVAIDSSPEGGRRTRTAIDAVSAAAADAGATIRTSWIGGEEVELESVMAELTAADAIILGSPVYRASYGSPLKRLLDTVPRTPDERRDSPLAGKAVALVFTGASLHHFLAVDDARAVLAGFFAAHVVPPGLYVPREGFEGSDPYRLADPYAAHARGQGAALVALARAVQERQELSSLRAQA